MFKLGLDYVKQKKTISENFLVFHASRNSVPPSNRKLLFVLVQNILGLRFTNKNYEKLLENNFDKF